MKKKITSQATRFLDSKKIDYELFSYSYTEKGGTAQTAEEFNIDENIVIKTLVFEDNNKSCFIVLQHGDKQVSIKQLARIIGIKKIEVATAQNAMKYTGYKFGGTSPFGIRKPMNIYIERTILNLERIYINGGGQGVIVSISPKDFEHCFEFETVSVSQ